jgi:hypothetical protein
LEVLETGGVTTGTTVISSGGALELDGAFSSSVIYQPGAVLEVGPAAVLQGGPLPTGVATAIIFSGATLSGGTASSGNLVEIFGLTSNGVDCGGKIIVFGGGTDLNGTLSKGCVGMVARCLSARGNREIGVGLCVDEHDVWKQENLASRSSHWTFANPRTSMQRSIRRSHLTRRGS